MRQVSIVRLGRDDKCEPVIGRSETISRILWQFGGEIWVCVLSQQGNDGKSNQSTGLVTLKGLHFE